MQVIEEFKKATEENEPAWFNELEETYGNDMEMEDIVKFGASKGFKFTLEELENQLNSDADDFNKKLDNDEIPEKMLELVSGGSSAACACRMVRTWFRGVC